MSGMEAEINIVLSLISDTIKVASFILSASSFLLSQYLSERKNHSPESELKMYYIPLLILYATIMLISLWNLCNLFSYNIIISFKIYYIVFSLIPIVTSIIFSYILIKNKPRL